MANQSRQLYQKLLKQGMQKEDAFFAVLDHFNELHWHDRNRASERLAKVESRLFKAENKDGE